MHHPVVGDSWLKKQARVFVDSSEKWWVKNFIRPIFFLLPPTIATAIATKSGLQQEVVAFFGQPVGDLLNHSALIVITGSFVYIATMKTIFSAIHEYSKPERELGSKDYLAIIHALNIVVGDKNKRFSTHLKKMLSTNSASPADTFNEITRPDQQIPLLVSGIKSVFEFIDEKNVFFRVGLMSVKDGSPSEWISFEPQSSPPRTKPDQLSAPTSAISCAIRTKSIVIIEDIQKELARKTTKQDRRYIRGHTQDGEHGSQLCYPVVHAATGNVEYVICIAGDQALCLQERHAGLYRWIIDVFATRITLEHSLLILKEKANVKSAA